MYNQEREQQGCNHWRSAQQGQYRNPHTPRTNYKEKGGRVCRARYHRCPAGVSPRSASLSAAIIKQRETNDRARNLPLSVA